MQEENHHAVLATGSSKTAVDERYLETFLLACNMLGLLRAVTVLHYSQARLQHSQLVLR